MKYLYNYIGGESMEENKKQYTISEMAKMIKLSEHTLRKYESDFNLKIPRNDMGHRYYTDKEHELLKQIIYWKSKGLAKEGINNLLGHSTTALEQKEQSMELVTLDKLTGKELAEVMAKQLSELVIAREEQLKEEMKHELQEQLELQEERIKDKVIEQFRAENSKLMDYLATTRQEDQQASNEKKGIWKKLFKK